MSNRVDKWANVLVATAALIIGGRAVSGMMSSAGEPVRPPVSLGPPQYESNWREVVEAGLSLGDKKAPVQLAVFTDLECPYCARFHLQVLPELLERFPEKINLVAVHVPIPGHRFAVIAATALECSDSQGRPAGFLNAVYEMQDSIGLRPWSRFAVEAGLSDTVRFMACLNSPPSPRIAQGKGWAERLQITSTPTVMLNGWRFSSIPSAALLKDMIDSVLNAEGATR